MELGIVCCRLTRSEENLQRKQDEFLDLRDQLERMRDDYDELRQQHTALQAQGNTREQQREMGVSASQRCSGLMTGSRHPYQHSACDAPLILPTTCRIPSANKIGRLSA
jgi:TolA-binding protein